MLLTTTTLFLFLPAVLLHRWAAERGPRPRPDDVRPSRMYRAAYGGVRQCRGAPQAPTQHMVPAPARQERACAWTAHPACPVSPARSARADGCNCITLYDPVCGRGGRLHSNACVAGCEKATVRFRCGSRPDCAVDCQAAAKLGCQCDRALTTNHVCAKSGKVYSGPCLLVSVGRMAIPAGAAQHRLRSMLAQGGAAGLRWPSELRPDPPPPFPCTPQECAKALPRFYCAGRNNCIQECAAAAADCVCTLEFRPVCGFDGTV